MKRLYSIETKGVSNESMEIKIKIYGGGILNINVIEEDIPQTSGILFLNNIKIENVVNEEEGKGMFVKINTENINNFLKRENEEKERKDNENKKLIEDRVKEELSKLEKINDDLMETIN